MSGGASRLSLLLVAPVGVGSRQIFMASKTVEVPQQRKQPAGVVWYRGTTAVGVPLLSLLILPVAFLVGHGLSTWMEL